MPNKTFLRVSGANTIDDHVGTFILLIAGDNLILAILAVSSVQGEELEQVHDLILCDHVHHADLYSGKGAVRFILGRVPRAIFRCGHADRPIPITLALSSKVEHVGHEHLRNALFIFVDVLCTIQPSNGSADRRFQLADGKREAVYQ